MVKFNTIPDDNKKFIKFLYEKGLLKKFFDNVICDECSLSSFEELFNEEHSNILDIIGEAFVWSYSNEGQSFWYRVYSELDELQT